MITHSAAKSVKNGGEHQLPPDSRLRGRRLSFMEKPSSSSSPSSMRPSISSDAPRPSNLSELIAHKSERSTKYLPNGFSRGLVQSPLFKHSITAAILLSFVQMGIAVERNSPEWKQVWRIWDILYTLLCTTEMLLMIEAYRLDYFRTFEMLTDFAVTVISILDVFVFTSAGIDGNLVMFRLLRLLRILRIMRIAKSYPLLHVTLLGLYDSFLSMFWIFTLLFGVLYCASICCVDLFGGKDAGYPAYNQDTGGSEYIGDFNNFVFFGTVFRSMITLLSMLLLSEWHILRQIAEVHIGAVPFFLFLLILVTFGILNVIIGIVVDRTTRAMDEPRVEQIEQSLAAKAELASDLSELLLQMDYDNDGRASLFELEQGLQNPRFLEKLECLDLPYNFTTAEFLYMLDTNGDGSLSRHEFVSGLLRLINCDDWQRDCLHAMSIGLVHRSVKELRRDFAAQLNDSVRAAIREEFHGLMHSSESHSAPVRANARESSRDNDHWARVSHSAEADWQPLPHGIRNVLGHAAPRSSRASAVQSNADMEELSSDFGTPEMFEPVPANNTLVSGFHQSLGESDFFDSPDQKVSANVDCLGHGSGDRPQSNPSAAHVPSYSKFSQSLTVSKAFQSPEQHGADDIDCLGEVGIDHIRQESRNQPQDDRGSSRENGASASCRFVEAGDPGRAGNVYEQVNEVPRVPTLRRTLWL